MKQYQTLFELDGVHLEEDALLRIVEMTQEKGIGALGLRSVLEDVMLDLMYEILSHPDVKACLDYPGVHRRRRRDGLFVRSAQTGLAGRSGFSVWER